MSIATCRNRRDVELQVYGSLCHFCGQSAVDVVWHHVSWPKLGEIGKLVRRGSMKKLDAELPKCRPAGRRCHDHHHANQKKGWTCPGKVESSPKVKGELDDEAAAVYEGV